MNFQIKHRYNDSILFEIEADSFVKAIEKGVKATADLRYANLQSSDLRYTNLRYANLQSADLRDAALRYANLRDPNLQSANLQSADLRDADLRYANLQYANLRDANLQSADLRSANLQSADLLDANLQSADLRDAALQYAIGTNHYQCTPLLILKIQTGSIRAFKLVNAAGDGPYNGGINYLDGKTFSVIANMDTSQHCAAGINLATLDWCMREWHEGYRILIMEFRAKRKNGSDNICIPTATDGKFRVWECKRVGEVDLQEIGLIKKGR